MRVQPERAPPGTLLSIVVPVLNEAANVRELVQRLTPELERLQLEWELLFVDDGSIDETLRCIKQLNVIDPRIKAVSLSRNFGKEIALAAGLKYASGDAVVLMDADLQHPPEVLPQFVSRWQEGFQVVYGQRIDRSTDSLMRRFISLIYYRLFNTLVKTDIPEGAGDFRLLDRQAVDAMNRIGETSRFNKGLFSWIGFKSVGVPYAVGERQGGGGSRWNLRRLLHFGLDGLTSFSTLPLRVSTILGLVVSIFAFAYAMIIILETLIFGIDVPGFPSLMISVMFFAGVQLIFLGIIGEYLGRIYEEVKARPLYLVAEEIGLSPTAARGGEHPPSGVASCVGVRVGEPL